MLVRPAMKRLFCLEAKTDSVASLPRPCLIIMPYVSEYHHFTHIYGIYVQRYTWYPQVVSYDVPGKIFITRYLFSMCATYVLYQYLVAGMINRAYVS